MKTRLFVVLMVAAVARGSAQLSEVPNAPIDHAKIDTQDSSVPVTAPVRLTLNGGNSSAVLVVTLERQALVVTGITTGGDVAIIGFLSDVQAGSPRVRVERTILRDDARTGTVQLSLPDNIPFRSIWTIVDLSTGAHVTTTPNGYLRRTLPMGVVTMRDDLAALSVDRASIEVVLVRPRVGAWHASAQITDATNRSNLAADRLREIGATAPGARHLRPGDILIICNTDWMEHGVAEVTAGNAR